MWKRQFVCFFFVGWIHQCISKRRMSTELQRQGMDEPTHRFSFPFVGAVAILVTKRIKLLSLSFCRSTCIVQVCIHTHTYSERSGRQLPNDGKQIYPNTPKHSWAIICRAVDSLLLLLTKELMTSMAKVMPWNSDGISSAPMMRVRTVPLASKSRPPVVEATDSAKEDWLLTSRMCV